VRPPRPDIPAPEFPRGLPWANVAMLRMQQMRARPVLVEFWDFCRPNSLRTLPYVTEWHRRYAGAGLRVVGIHTGGFPPSEDPAAVRAAVERLGVEHPVVIDEGQVMWDLYGNLGWPARYLWGADPQVLVDFHYGEGAYAETERAIQAELGVERELVAPVRPEDEPGVLLPPQTEDQPGAYNGPYEAGGVWVVVSGRGVVTAGGRPFAVTHPGCLEVVAHPRHTRGELRLEAEPGVTVHATCFTPGVA
jgi:thiol-disulfide isomerase/thioredoxin